MQPETLDFYLETGLNILLIILVFLLIILTWRLLMKLTRTGDGSPLINPEDFDNLSPANEERLDSARNCADKLGKAAAQHDMIHSYEAEVDASRKESFPANDENKESKSAED